MSNMMSYIYHNFRLVAPDATQIVRRSVPRHLPPGTRISYTSEGVCIDLPSLATNPFYNAAWNTLSAWATKRWQEYEDLYQPEPSSIRVPLVDIPHPFTIMLTSIQRVYPCGNNITDLDELNELLQDVSEEEDILIYPVYKASLKQYHVDMEQYVQIQQFNARREEENESRMAVYRQWEERVAKRMKILEEIALVSQSHFLSCIRNWKYAELYGLAQSEDDD